MNIVDAVLLLILSWAALRGFRQGAVSQLAGFGGAVAGLLLGSVFAPKIAGALIAEPGANLSLLTLTTLLAAIFIGQAIGVAVGFRLRRAAMVLGAGALDRGAGIVVGIAGVVLTIWLLGSALMQGPFPSLARHLQASQVIAGIDSALPPPPDVISRVAAFLDRQGFPQVFAGLGGGTLAPPVPPPSEGAVAAAAAAGQPSTVQVQALGCGGISSGSGFVTQPGFVVTNAHVIAGGEEIIVRDQAGEHAAQVVLFDPNVDLAVLAAPGVTAPPIAFVSQPATRGVAGAVLGFPGGQRELAVQAATVRGRQTAVGRDIYGTGLVQREILTLDAVVVQGNSGGPFVTSDGLVAGVVFAAAAAEPGVGYALTAEQVREEVGAAVAGNQPVGTGPCRF